MDNSEQKDLVEDLLHDEELMRLLAEEPEDESAEQIVTDSPDRVDNQSSVQKTILLYLHDFAYLHCHFGIRHHILRFADKFYGSRI